MDGTDFKDFKKELLKNPNIRRQYEKSKGGVMFSRKELQHIREKALEEASIQGLNPSWRHVLLRLANATDHLDAMIARSSETIRKN